MIDFLKPIRFLLRICWYQRLIGDHVNELATLACATLILSHLGELFLDAQFSRFINARPPLSLEHVILMSYTATPTISSTSVL